MSRNIAIVELYQQVKRKSGLLDDFKFFLITDVICMLFCAAT